MPPRLSFDSERGGNGLQRPSESGSTSGECLPAGSPKSLSSEPRQKRRGRPADSPKGPSTGLAQKRVSNSSFLELLADGLRATSASLGSRMRASSHSASEEGFEQRDSSTGRSRHTHFAPGLGYSTDMEDLEEENEEQMYAMMTSMERRQTTDPRALALASAGRESRKVLKTQPMGETRQGAGQTKEAQRMVFMNAQGDHEFQESLKGFANNRVRTAKYNVVTFLPLFLFEMFSRAAYFYFLCQACLSWWEVISPLGGTGATAALLFVLGVSGIKAVAEDRKRHQEDRRTNVAVAHVMSPDGETHDVQWQDVKVGDILMVKDDELIPADLLCLHVPMKDGVCYIKTTNLDGESNLKIRRPVQLDMESLREKGPEGLLRMKGVLECEVPNADLHTFRGCFSCEASESTSTASFPVTMNEVLLRGCLVKNTGCVFGLVVYTGDDTRIQQNAAKTPFKVGAYDTLLNLQIAILMFLQAVLCVFGSAMATVWRDEQAVKRYYLGADQYVQGNFQSSVGFGIVTLLTYWIILSYMVPISLFVTMEVVKFWQGFMFINMDPYMVDPDSLEGARCRNSNLMEDLGKIEYVFSDKTGTLTSNEMRLRQVAIKGTIYGSAKFKLEDHVGMSWEKCMELFDDRMIAPMRWLQKKKLYADIVAKGGSSHSLLRASGSKSSLSSLANSCSESMETEGPGCWLNQAAHAVKDSALKAPTPISKKTVLPPLGGQTSMAPQLAAALHRLEAEILNTNEGGVVGMHHVDFWLNICICHSLIVERGPTGELIYQGPSPDEVALVEAGKQLGYVFKHRDANNVYLDFQGVDLQFQLLNVIDFSSERKRMSVVVKCPDGTVRLFCKGADNAILDRLSPGQEADFMELTDRNLRMFAQQGLRTLCLGTKVVQAGAYRDWDERFQAATALIDGREEQMSKLQDEVERDLELVGVTAIEDKLQDGVPEAIATLLEAGVKVWMITGDKQETAINIATSCRLLKKSEGAMICNSDSYLAARYRLRELLDIVDPGNAIKRAACATPAGSLSTPPPELDNFLGGASGAKRDHELVIDGHTLTHILGTNLESSLSELASHCSGVVVCRASPSQKACIVKLMKDYECKQAIGNARGIEAWRRKFEKKVRGKMLSIGDGANDVAMIQAADVGVGIMGKEGRQAVNNSDFALAQFRFLVRLMLVHGQLSDYRLSNLIVYSFYKNMCFAAVLFSFQFFCGFSGQTLVDDMTAAGFNVIFTSLPIMLFSVLDRQVGDTSYMAYPQTYNKRSMLGTLSFWRRAILHGVLDGVCSFAVPYLAVNNTDGMSRGGLYCLSKTCFFALLGTVTLEVIMMTKYWTWLFAVVIAASYLLAYAFVLVFPLIGILMGWPDPAQQGIAATLFSSPSFYLTILAANMSTMGFRMYVFWMRSLVKPSDTEIVAAREKQPCPWSELSRQTRDRLAGLSMHVVDCPEAVGNAEPGPSGNVGKPCATPQHKAVPTAQAGWKDTEMNRPSSSSALLP